jgi:hypothetical protein
VITLPKEKRKKQKEKKEKEKAWLLEGMILIAQGIKILVCNPQPGTLWVLKKDPGRS